MGSALRIPEISVVEVYLENNSDAPLLLRDPPLLLNSEGKVIRPLQPPEYYAKFCPRQMGCLPYAAFGWMRLPFSRPPWPSWIFRIRRPDTRSAQEWQHYLHGLAIREDDLRRSYDLLPGLSASGRFAFPWLFAGSFTLKMNGMPDLVFEQTLVKRHRKRSTKEAREKLRADEAWIKREEERLKQNHRLRRKDRKGDTALTRSSRLFPFPANRIPPRAVARGH